MSPSDESLRQRLSGLLGTDRRSRIVTVATLAALVVATLAFLSLRSTEDSSESAYLQSLDQACVAEKERVIALEEETLRHRPPNLGEFSSVLVTVMAEWRASLRGKPVPAEYGEEVAAYEASLLHILIEAGGLARLTREEAATAATRVQAKAVDQATARTDEAIEELGLSECAKLAVAPGSDS